MILVIIIIVTSPGIWKKRSSVLLLPSNPNFILWLWNWFFQYYRQDESNHLNFTWMQVSYYAFISRKSTKSQLYLSHFRQTLYSSQKLNHLLSWKQWNVVHTVFLLFGLYNTFLLLLLVRPADFYCEHSRNCDYYILRKDTLNVLYSFFWCGTKLLL